MNATAEASTFPKDLRSILRPLVEFVESFETTVGSDEPEAKAVATMAVTAFDRIRKLPLESDNYRQHGRDYEESLAICSGIAVMAYLASHGEYPGDRPPRRPFSLRATRRKGTEEFMELVLLLLLAAPVLYFSRLHRRVRENAGRARELKRWASEHGLELSRETLTDVDTRFPRFECLQRGRLREARNELSGSWKGRPLLGFDYSYVTGDGEGMRIHRLSAVVVTTGVHLRPLRLTPRAPTLHERVAAFLSDGHRDTESAEFNRSFRIEVADADRRWAFDLLHQRTMEFLLSSPRFWIEIAGDHAIAHRRAFLRPEELGEAADVLAGILDRLPGYVVDERLRRFGPSAGMP